MTDKPKGWPYLAAEARDRSAEETVKAIKLLEPLREKEGRVSLAMIHLLTAMRFLESVGAKTRPE